MRAPLIVFSYNRPEHLKKCIQALGANQLASETPIYVFSDGPKNAKDIEKVNAVREYLYSIEKSKIFKSISIILAERNKGLANSVIGGVTEILKKYDRVIVVEDDSIASTNFLEYMNKCLEIYQNCKYIGAVGGFTIPITFPKHFSDDVFLMTRGSSYAWATWRNRWEMIDWQVNDYNKFKYNPFKRMSFNKYAPDRARMLDKQMEGYIDSWAIRFSYSMHKNKMLWVMPKVSKIKTIGFDGSGTHCNINSIYNQIKIDTGNNPEEYTDAQFNKKIANQYGKHFKARNKNIRIISYCLRKVKDLI